MRYLAVASWGCLPACSLRTNIHNWNSLLGKSTWLLPCSRVVWKVVDASSGRTLAIAVAIALWLHTGDRQLLLGAAWVQRSTSHSKFSSSDGDWPGAQADHIRWRSGHARELCVQRCCHYAACSARLANCALTLMLSDTILGWGELRPKQCGGHLRRAHVLTAGCAGELCAGILNLLSAGVCVAVVTAAGAVHCQHTAQKPTA